MIRCSMGGGQFLAAVAFHVTKADGYRAGLAWVELSTGECVAASGSKGRCSMKSPGCGRRRCWCRNCRRASRTKSAERIERAGRSRRSRRGPAGSSPRTTPRADAAAMAGENGGGFGFADDDPAVFAAAAVLSYLEETQKTGLGHIRPLRRHVVEDHLSIDPASWRSLEIDRTSARAPTEGSLLTAIDRTRTPHGWPAAAAMAAHAAVRSGAYPRPAERDCGVAGIAGGAESGDRRKLETSATSSGSSAGSPWAGPGRAIWRRLANAWLACRFSTIAIAGAPRTSRRSLSLASRSFCAEQAAFSTARSSRSGAASARGRRDRRRVRRRNSIACAISAPTASSGSPNIRRAGAERTSPRCASASTKSSATTSKSPTPTATRPPPTGRASRRPPTAERYITEELKKFEEEALGAQDKSIALEQRCSSRSARRCCRMSRSSRNWPQPCPRGCAVVFAALAARAALLPAGTSSRSACWRSSMAGIPCSNSSSAASSSPTTRNSPPTIRPLPDHRPQHGRQKHLHPPGRAHHAAGADRQLRPRQERDDRPGRSALHPHRRQRRAAHRANRPSWSR
jgi:hypothetical protein